MSEVKDKYFEKLFQGNKSVTIDEAAKIKREAYDKAHDIRKFEIQMYWTRSAYLWALQAASLAGLAAILATTEKISVACKEDDCTALMRLLVIIAIWFFGTFSAYVWIMLLKGAKFWQDNWERHVDYLEDDFSGSLYKTYASNAPVNPYSVTKLNLAMALFSFMIWIAVGSAGFVVLLPSHLWLLPLLYLFIFPSLRLIDDDLRMSDFKQEVELTDENGKMTYITSRKV